MQRLAIREGWATVILSALLVYIAVVSIQRADWADGLGILTGVMVAGLVSGLVVSKWRRLPSAVLHLGGFVVGLLSVVFALTRYLDDSIGNTRDKLRWLWERGEGWVQLLVRGEQAEDLYLFVLFITALTFTMAYLTMWFIFRARWIWAALFFPGVVLLLNLGYSLRVPNGLVVLFIFVSLLLLMRFTLLQREINWRRVRIDYPSTLMWRGMWAASYLALAVIIFGWALPVSARSETAHDLWRDVDGPWRSVEKQVNQWFVGLRGPGQGGVGGFAAFEDNFQLGGPLSLSEDPVVVVDAPGRSPYLQAHTYNVYSGRGWESDLTPPVEEGEPAIVPPQFELRPGESRPVDPSFARERERQTFEVQIERTRGSLLFSPPAFVSADVGTNLVIAWREEENAVDVQSATPETIPADLWPYVSLLQSVNLTPDVEPEPTAAEGESTPEASPTPTPLPEPDYSKLPTAQLATLRDQLIEKDIQVSYTINSTTYLVQTLNYSGQFPVLDDVEAIRAQDELVEGDSYSVEAMVSDATGDELRQADGEIPPAILDRYLGLPETVTDRTVALAEDIASGQSNTYDTARALESYLRENITYSESIDFPPEDVDVVDYALFTSREGYCEYYASAFVVMARSLGIPARMSVGFFPTDEEVDDGYMYRERNAHAWPEIYFPEYGWVGFEPTAAREEVNRDVATPASGGGTPLDERSGRVGEGILEDDLNSLDPLFDEQNELLPTGTGAIGAENDGPAALDIALRVVPLLLLLGVLVIAYLWMRGTRGMSPSNQMYAKLAKGATWGGIRAERAMTPHEYAEHISGTVSGSRQPVTYLTDLFVQETYGKVNPTQAELLRARQAWLRLRSLFLRHFVSRLLFWRSNVETEYDDDEW